MHYEPHTTGLFSRATWERLLAERGFSADVVVESTDEDRIARSLFVARKPVAVALRPTGEPSSAYQVVPVGRVRGGRAAPTDDGWAGETCTIELASPMAVDLTRFVIPEGGDPLSLRSRLAASVPAPRLSPFGEHEARPTVRYAGVLASASKVRARLAPKPAVPSKPTADVTERPRRGCYRPWAELLKRTFGFDVLTCPRCRGRMKLLALVTDPTSVADTLRDPRRGSTCGASASRPTCRSGRPLEDRRTGQVVCSVEVPGASRRPSRTCTTSARRPRCARMPLARVRQPPCQGRNRLVKAPISQERPAWPISSSPMVDHTSRRFALHPVKLAPEKGPG